MTVAGCVVELPLTMALIAMYSARSRGAGVDQDDIPRGQVLTVRQSNQVSAFQHVIQQGFILTRERLKFAEIKVSRGCLPVEVKRRPQGNNIGRVGGHHHIGWRRRWPDARDLDGSP